MKLSVVIPVYNRPEELKELLYTLSMQQHREQLEVIVIDDGSILSAKGACDTFSDRLQVIYAWQKNAGPAVARNRGAILAQGQWLYFLDSDCILPSDFLERIARVLARPMAPTCFGTRDEAHPFFTPLQKAISFAMTSVLTTGGIRGGTQGRNKAKTFYPRSYSMGISRGMFNNLGGFADMRYGEDVDLSMRVAEAGGRLELITSTYVFHKRRTTLAAFAKQTFCSGVARIDLTTRHPGSLRLVHLLPTLAVAAFVALLVFSITSRWWLCLLPLLFAAAVFFGCLQRWHSLRTAWLAIWAAVAQIGGYGCGLPIGFVRRKILHHDKWIPFHKTLYD